MKIRFAKLSDISDMSDLGTKNYSDSYYEDNESFSSKVLGCQEGCFVADLDGVIGYIVSFPYLVGHSFPINTKYEPVIEQNCWYIHDLCVSKDFRNRGVAQKLAETITNTNKVIGLTAVQNSEKFWERLGFRSFFELDYCGHKASYMLKINAF